MMPITDEHIPAMEHQIDYKQKYKALKKKLKFLVYEQECFLEEMRKAQRKLLKIYRDRSFLLDRLLPYEKIDESSGDSDATASSDSETEGSSLSRKRKAMLSQGQITHLQYNMDPAIFGVAAGNPTLLMAAEPPKKKSKASSKKGTAASLGKGGGKGTIKTEKTAVSNQMTREEVERHLESRQKDSFGIEKAPAMLPMEIFSNDNSNPDSEPAMDIKEEYDSDLVIDAGQ